VVDAVELTKSFLAVASERGALALTHTRLTSAERDAPGWRLSTTRGEVYAERVVNAAGLWADQVAEMFGVRGYRIHPCRGDYFRLRGGGSYKHLIYPVKEKEFPGLGVHVILERGGGVRVGPDAQYVEKRDDHTPRPEKLAAFHEAAQRLLGSFPKELLSYDSCGIRPKLRAPDEAEEKDFVLSTDAPGVINLVGIESPGLTACMDLADRVAEM
jgi:L-2-hydroxyglutarate oxidase LhgO